MASAKNDNKEDETFHSELANDIAKDMDSNFNIISENKDSKSEELPEWIHVTDYDNIENSQWMWLQLIPIDNNRFVAYNRRFNDKPKFKGIYIYNILKNEWTLSSEINYGKPILIVNTATYNKNTDSLHIYAQFRDTFWDYNFTKDEWIGSKNDKRCDICSTGKVFGYGKNDTGPINYNWTDKPTQCILCDNILYIFGLDWGYKSFNINYYDNKSEKTKYTENDHKNTKIFNNNSSDHDSLYFTAITQMIYIKSKNCIYILFERGEKLYKFLIDTKEWNIVKNISIEFREMKLIKYTEQYIIFYGGYYHGNKGWSKYQSSKENRHIFIFNTDNETLIECKVQSPFQTDSYSQNNLYSAIIVNDYIYMLSMGGSLVKMNVKKLIESVYDSTSLNPYEEYFKLVQDIDMKTDIYNRTLDINYYIKNEQELVPYLLLYSFFNYSDVGWTWSDYNMSLNPPSEEAYRHWNNNDTSADQCKVRINDPFKNFYSKWKNEYIKDKKLAINKYCQVINMIINMQRCRKISFIVSLGKKYELSDISDGYCRLTNFEKKCVLLKFYKFIGNDLIKLGIDGIKELDNKPDQNHDNYDEYMYLFKLYKINYNNDQDILDINCKLNGVYNKYQKFTIEPWPDYGIKNVEICKKYKFLYTIGKGRTCERVISAVDRVNDSDKKENDNEDHKQNDNEVAIKIISKKGGKKNELLYKNEVNILKKVLKLNNTNIIKFMECGEDINNYYIISKLYKGFELTKRREHCFPGEDIIKEWLIDILDIIKSIHSLNIVIRDLKFEDWMENVLYQFTAHRNQYKPLLILMDLGYAKCIEDDKLYDKELVHSGGYDHYTAPELLSNDNSQISGKELKSIDVWNIGIILYQCIWNELPFKNMEEIKNEELKFPETYRDEVPLKLKHLSSKLLLKDPKLRLNIDDALNHPYFTGEYLAPESWIELAKPSFKTAKDDAEPHLFQINNNQIYLKAFFYGKYDHFWHKECGNLYCGFFIYDISKNEWTKTIELTGIDTKKSMRDKDDKRNIVLTKIFPSTIKYNNKLNTLTMYEYHEKKLIEYDINNNKWNINKYPKRYLYDGHKNEKGERAVMVHDRLHIFTMNNDEKTYEHWSINYGPGPQREEIWDDISEFNEKNIKLPLFDRHSHLLYSNIKHCIWLIATNWEEKQGIMKYNIFDKKWSIIEFDNIDLSEYPETRCLLCKNEEYILLYGARGKYSNSPRNIDLLLFNTKTETIKKSKITGPYEDSNEFASKKYLWKAINIDEKNKDTPILINGYLRSSNENSYWIPQNILDLIHTYIPTEYIYMVSMEGYICKIPLSKIE